MNKLFAVLPLVAVLVACKQEPAPAPVATSAPAPVSAPAPTTEAPAANAAADLPKECQDYLDKVAACVAKQSGAAADAMKSGVEQAKASWASIPDKAQLGSACKMATDGFAAQAAAMKC